MILFILSVGVCVGAKFLPRFLRSCHVMSNDMLLSLFPVSSFLFGVTSHCLYFQVAAAQLPIPSTQRKARSAKNAVLDDFPDVGQSVSAQLSGAALERPRWRRAATRTVCPKAQTVSSLRWHTFCTARSTARRGTRSAPASKGSLGAVPRHPSRSPPSTMSDHTEQSHTNFSVTSRWSKQCVEHRTGRMHLCAGASRAARPSAAASTVQPRPGIRESLCAG